MAKQLNVNLSVSADTSQARAQLQQLQQSLQQLKTTPITLGTDVDLSKTIGQVNQLQHYLQQATNTDTGVLNFTKLSNSIKSSGTTLQEYGKTLLSLGPQGKNAFNQLATAVSKAQIPIVSLNSTFSQLWTVMKNTMRWQLSSSAMHAITGALSSAWQYAQNLNESLNNIQIVTKHSDDQMAKFAESANKAAKELSTTTTAYTNASLIYYQQGLNDKQVKERTDVTVKMANVTGQSAQQVSDQMTAIWNNFDDGSHSLEYYADVITALGAATASSSEEISRGLEKFAAIADTVGLSYENATAALATITATTRQSADTVGTGLRTLFSRLQSLSLGETLEDGVNLTKYSKALEKVGVQALDSEGNLRRMDDVLSDLGEKWQTLSKAQQTALAQTVGGVRQYTTLMALMNNNDFYKQNVNVAKGSSGELQAQADIYEKSWKAAQKRVRASAESIFSDVIDDDFFITLSDGLAGLLGILDDFIDGLGGIKGLILSIVAAVTTLNQGGSTRFFNSVINGMKSLTPKGRESLFAEQKAAIAGFQDLTKNKSYVTPISRAQNDIMNYNLDARMAYLNNKNNYNEMQDLQAQGLLSHLEGLNSALMSTAQNLEQLSASASSVNQSFIDAIGNSASAHSILQRDEFKAYTNVQGGLQAFGLNTKFNIGLDELSYYKDTAKALLTSLQGSNVNLGISASPNGPTLQKLLTDLSTSTDVGNWEATMLQLEGALQTLRSSIVHAAEEAATKTRGDQALNEATRAATEALEHETRVREENTRGQQLRGEAQRIPGLLNEIPKTQGHISPGQYITEGMSILSTTAMGMSMARGTWSQIASAVNGSGSWGDALLSAGTSLPFAAMMFKNAGSKLNQSTLLNSAFKASAKSKIIQDKAIFQAIKESTNNGLSEVEALNAGKEAGEAALAKAGLGTKLGAVLPSLMGYVAPIAAVGTAIWVASDLIVTAKERFEELNKQLENNKQRLSEVTEKYETLNNNFSKQKSLDEQIKSAKIGSIEQRTAMLQANQNAQQIIIDNNLTTADYTIKNGQIIFNEGVEKRLQEASLTAMKQANQQVLETQGAVATQKVQKDYEEALRQIKYDTQDEAGNIIGTYYDVSAAERWAKANSQYGYTSGQQVIDAIKGGNIQDQMYLTGGAALKNRMALEQKVLDQYGEISEDNSIIIDRLAQDKAFYDKTESETAINTSGGAAFLSALNFFETSKSSGNMTLGELTRYAEENYKQQYKDLIESDEYKQAGRKEQRRKLADLIETNKRQEAIDEKFQKDQKDLEDFQAKYGNNAKILDQSADTLFAQGGIFGDLASGQLSGIQQEFAEAYINQYHQAQEDYLELGAKIGAENLEYGKWSANEAQKIVDTTKKFQSAFGDEFAKTIFTQLNNGKSLGTLADLELTGNTIADLKTLKKTNLKDATGQSYFESAVASLGGEKGILEALYDSEGFSDSLQSLQKIFKQTGKISADNILDAAESCEELSDYLEISGINAQGLSDALEMVELGDISSIDQLSNGLLKALSIAGELKNDLAETYKHIDNFDAGRSTTDILSFTQKLAKNIQTSFDIGSFADEPLLKSWGELFGDSGRTEYLKAAREYASQGMSETEIQDALKNKFSKEFELFESLGKAEDMMPAFEYGLNNLKEDSQYNDIFRIIDGNFQVNEDNLISLINSTTDLNDLYSSMAEEMGLSQDTVQGMIAHMASAYPSIKQAIEENSLKKAFEEGMFGEGEIVNAQGIRAFINQYKDAITGMSEIDFAQALGLDSLDGLSDKTMTIEKAFEMLKQKANDAGAKVFDLGKDFDYVNASFQDLYDAWKSNGNNGSIWDYFSASSTKKGYGTITYDVDKLLAQYKELGITGATAYKMIDEQLEQYGGKLERIQKDLEGKDVTTTRKLGESTEDFITRSNNQLTLQNQQIVNQDLADKIAQGLGEIKLNIDGTEISATVQDAVNNNGAGWDIVANVTNASQITSAIASAIAAGIAAGTSGSNSASGYNNASFAGGKHSNGQYEGLAEVGELGPELFIHDGQPYLAGIHGRTKAYIHKDDQIYTAAQTQKILDENPSLQDIPGFKGGKNNDGWHGGGYSSSNSNANSSNVKTSKWEPERYHLITRQLKDLQREYDRLSKIKDNCYGTNKLEAIQKEIDATDNLIAKQQDLIQESKDYLKIDTDRLRGMLSADEFQIDENGNLLNFEELQQKYRKKAEEDKDEKAQDIWKALTQYEETLDKLHESQDELQDLIYQQMDLRLETITTKVDMKINFDEREIKLLDHYIKRIDDNIYYTAEVLALTQQKLSNINQKINDTREGINGLFEELSDSEGNLIRKEDGSAYTMEEWLALSNEQRDMLNINGKFGEQLEEYMDNLLDYIEELEEFKTKGVEEFGEAFNELNDNVRSSIDLFDHYNQLLSNLKNITDLQGVKISAEMKAAMREIDAAMFSNTQNNIDAERENYRRLNSEVIDLRKKIAETQDETLKTAWKEQLKTAEEQLRTSESNMLSLWETGLQQAKDMYMSALDDAATEYESTISGMYGTVDELQKAWDQQKRNSEFYVKDFEKYYQISKLQRSITADLANQQKNGFKQSEGLKKLQDELNAARDNGVQLSAYDLDIYSKRYEYEKALMDLEDSRNAKSQVRLQRDANGNWGYVYTNNADEDDILAKQQAVDDKLYELQKATQDRVTSINDEMISEITGVGQRLKELRSSGANQETIDKYLEQEKLYLENYRKGLDKALQDAGMTVEDAKLRYGEEGFDILDQFQESLLSSITGDGDLDEFFDKVLGAMGTADDAMATAGNEYINNLDAINKWFNESGEDLATVIKGFASIINSESNGNLIDSKEQIQNAKDTFDEILKVATDFEKEFIKIYQPIIDENERLVGDLLKALHALNREEYEGPGDNSKGETIADIIGDTTPTATPTTAPKKKQKQEQEENESPTSDGTPKHYRKPEELIEDLASRLRQAIINPRFAWQDKVQIAKMDNGGYTGAWGDDGRLAILHEKEEVFSKDDTLRLLNAAEILRRIDLQAALMSKGISNFDTIDRGLTFNKANDLLEQMVTITAEFPNATNHSEIEEAFTNLINKASQYANRKGI